VFNATFNDIKKSVLLADETRKLDDHDHFKVYYKCNRVTCHHRWELNSWPLMVMDTYCNGRLYPKLLCDRGHDGSLFMWR